MAAPRRARSLPEIDDALAGLARAVERHSRMITAGRGETAALAKAVEQLSSSLRLAVEAWSISVEPPAGSGARGSGQDQPAEAAQSTAPGPAGEDDDVLPSWLVTTDWEAGEKLTTELARWVREVYLRWPDTVLPACWPLHPWVVEELWVLRCCWVEARTGESASWQRWQDWHDRQRPATARRVAEGLQRCAPDQHAPARGGAYPPVPGADVVALAATAWATEGHQAWPPQVPVELLDEPERTRSYNGGQRPHSVPRRTLTPHDKAQPPDQTSPTHP